VAPVLSAKKLGLLFDVEPCHWIPLQILDRSPDTTAVKHANSADKPHIFTQGDIVRELALYKQRDKPRPQLNRHSPQCTVEWRLARGHFYTVHSVMPKYRTVSTGRLPTL